MKRHDVALRYIKTVRPPVTLQFVEKPLSMDQARLRDRTVMEPELALKDFKFRAVIDWLEIFIETVDAKQFKDIQAVVSKNHGRKPWVEAQEQGPGGNSRTFLVRMQEPTVDLAIAAMEAVGAKYALAGDPVVTSLEISVDARPLTPSDEARARMLGAMHRCFFTTRDFLTGPNDRPRFSYKEGKKPTFLFPAASGRAKKPKPLEFWANATEVPVDATLSIGRKDGPSMWKIMDKVVDQQNLTAGTFLAIPDDEKRARIEVTLGTEELETIGIQKLSDLKSFEFSRLQGSYFRFMLPTYVRTDHLRGVQRLVHERLENWKRETFLATGLLGLRALEASRARQRERNRHVLKQHIHAMGRKLAKPQRRGIGFSGEYVAWKEMSKRVAAALGRLGERGRK